MKPFTYHAPTTVDEAVAMLEQYQASCAVVAGGTDVIIELNERHKAPEHVIAIDKLSELRYIKEEGGLVKIGALTSFDDLENDAYVQAHLPALLETAVHVGSPQIRNLGTVGGNVVNASVAGDSPTTFLTYDAQVVLKSAKGERIMTIEDFNKGPGNCAIRPDYNLTIIRDGVLVSRSGLVERLAGVLATVKIFPSRVLAIVVCGDILSLSAVVVIFRSLGKASGHLSGHTERQSAKEQFLPFERHY